MSWTTRCCRLRLPATPHVNPPSRPSFASSTVHRRALSQSKPDTPPAISTSKPITLNASNRSLSRDQETAAGSASLADTSIWEEEGTLRQLELERQRQSEQRRLGKSPLEKPPAYPLEGRNAESMAAVLDPRPNARIQFERRMVIQETRKRGRLTQAQVLKRTERVYTRKSEMYKTGMKKVMLLARQIAGKTVDDAITQMRFSKKQASIWIHDHLVESRDRAIVERGMGLGAVNGENMAVKKIELKDGSRHKITDPTRIYIDQAWVGKGTFGRGFKKRAKSRIDVMKLPQTSLTVMLKEEKTRIRQWKERCVKEENKKVWMQLPNRPITGPQRAYYSW